MSLKGPACKSPSGTPIARALQGGLLGLDAWLLALRREPPENQGGGATREPLCCGDPGSASAEVHGLAPHRTHQEYSPTEFPHTPGRLRYPDPELQHGSSAAGTAVPGRDFAHACALQKEVPPPCGSRRLIGTVSGLGPERKGLGTVVPTLALSLFQFVP